jgi:Tfp pilus assembly protein PilN
MTLDQLVQKPDLAPAGRRALTLRRRPEVIIAGGLPTVSLIPRELRAAARERATRRYLIMGVVTALLVAVAATAGSTVLAGAAQARLDSANAQTQELVGQLAKFRDVQKLQRDIAAGDAAVTVVTSTEIDWQAQIESIEAEMPKGFSVTSLQADSATPVAAYGQGASPLEKPRAATVQMSVTARDISGLPRWLRMLRSIPAYADATASVLSDGSGTYTVQLIIHLSPKALVAAEKTAK